MRLELVEDDLVEQALTLLPVLNAGKHSTHANVVRLQLCNDILPQAPRAKAHTVAEVADPAAIILAHIEVVIVAQLEACVAEFAIAAILRFLRKLEMALQVDRVLLGVQLQDARYQSLW